MGWDSRLCKVFRWPVISCLVVLLQRKISWRGIPSVLCVSEGCFLRMVRSPIGLLVEKDRYLAEERSELEKRPHGFILSLPFPKSNLPSLETRIKDADSRQSRFRSTSTKWVDALYLLAQRQTRRKRIDRCQGFEDDRVSYSLLRRASVRE